MRIVSWNVNSIRARLEQLSEFLRGSSPDVVCLQETKVEDDKFPHGPISDMGFRAVTFGQKTYNGVAILARYGLSVEDVKRNLDGDAEDAHRRAIACTVEGVRILNVYVPNGQAVGTPAFAYKLAWLDRLLAELEAHTKPTDDFFLCGDFNVAPEPIDVHNPKRWEGQVLFHPNERARLKKIMDRGLVDIVRKLHPEETGLFSWWDYRMGAYKRNSGLRIDLALLSEPLAARATAATIDRAPRERERPSDHAPVVVDVS